jgi:hypothetical protein
VSRHRWIAPRGVQRRQERSKWLDKQPCVSKY